MIADAHYFFYHTAYFKDATISTMRVTQICFNNCSIYGKSTDNTQLEGLGVKVILHDNGSSSLH
jgi:hypothetical protein